MVCAEYIARWPGIKCIDAHIPKSDDRSRPEVRGGWVEEVRQKSSDNQEGDAPVQSEDVDFSTRRSR